MAKIIWDPRPLYVYLQTEEKKFKVIEKRYSDFVQFCNDLTREPVTVFDPLHPKLLEELHMIREVSKVLQIKKEEDIRKQAAEAEDEPEKEKNEKEEVKEVEEEAEAEKTDA